MKKSGAKTFSVRFSRELVKEIDEDCETGIMIVVILG